MFKLVGISLFLILQQGSDSEDPFVTNSGEEFDDPFVNPNLDDQGDRGDQNEDLLEEESFEDDPFDTDSTEQQNFEDNSRPEEGREEPSPSSPFVIREEKEKSPRSNQRQPATGSSPGETEKKAEPFRFPGEPEAPEINEEPDFRPPEEEPAKGPVSEDFLTKKRNEKGTPAGTWSFALDAGLALNIQDREDQVHLEGEGGYRLASSFELKGITYFRFIGDRLWGLLLMPTYIHRLTGRDTTRWDLHFGLGAGWTLQGIEGNDFQIGLLPARFSSSAVYYGLEDFALVGSLDVEGFFYRAETEGESESLTSEPLVQLILSFGARFEF